METEPPHHRDAPTKGSDAGRPTSRPATGGWKAALFIIGVEVAERSAFFGLASNLITYLTGPLGESTAAAAAAVNVWSGVAFMMPLAGAFVADSYLGRYRTVLLASMLYLVGLCMLTLSSMLPNRNASDCNDAAGLAACTRARFQATIFFSSLYLIAFAQGGHRPSVQAFGADQFDANDPEESKAKSSFFNWWNFGVCTATMFTNLALYYVQDTISWTLGFGIPWILMVVALAFFLLGTRSYRYHLMEDANSFAKVWKALIGSAGRRSSFAAPKNEAREALLPRATEHAEHSDYSQDESAGSGGQVEEAKALLQTFPIWGTCLIPAVVVAQSGTLLIKQASTLDRRVGASFQVPPAAFQSFTVGISAVAFIPIYDRVVVPTARNFTGLPSGITMLQRIGTGIVLSVITMVVTALVEMRRLKTARDFGLVDLPGVTIPMSIWWLMPSYVFYGMMHVLLVIGLQEFFYDQVPDAMRSLGLALYASILGFGDLLSGFLVSLIDRVTARRGESWFCDNLNRAHLDYFYWLLAGLSSMQLLLYLGIARSYVYKRKGTIIV